MQKEKTLNKEPGVIPGFIRHSMDETNTYYIASEYIIQLLFQDIFSQPRIVPNLLDYLLSVYQGLPL